MLHPTVLAMESVALAWALPTVLFGLVLIGGGLYLLVPELRRHRRAPIDVYEAPQADGNVTLRGTAVADGGTLEAPFTAIDCLAYRYEVEEVDAKAGKGGRNWTTLASGSEAVPFRLEDDTGSILVEADGDECHFTDHWRSEVEGDETVRGHAREFLESLDDVDPGDAGERSLGPVSLNTGDTRRYTEHRLEPDETVTVDGPVETDPDAAREWGSGTVNAAVRSNETGELAVADAAELPLLRSDVYVPGGLVLGGVALVGWVALTVAGVV